MLYPYCRCAINSVLSDSTFPNSTLQPINFFAIYEDQKNQKNDKDEIESKCGE